MATKKVLVASTYGYAHLTSILDDFESSLYSEMPNEKFEFYVVNVIYHREKPENIKYKYYIHSSDCNNLEELERISEEVKKWNVKFDYSFQISEYAVEILGYINSKLNFEGIKYEDIHKFRDKVIMKTSISANIKKPKLYDIDDIKKDIIKYPVIVKPRCFAGSWGVQKFSSKEDLLLYLNDKKCDYTRKSNYNINDVEVEEYIDAPICHIDGLVFNGNIVICVASEYIGTCLDYSNGKTLGSIIGTDEQQEKALPFANKINKSLKLPNGVFHLEAFWNKNDFIFLEIAVRFGGAEIVPNFEKAYGINLIHEHIKCQLGIKPPAIKNLYKYFGFIIFPKPVGLVVDSYIKNIKFEFKPKSMYLSKIPKVGEKANVPFVQYSNNLGSFAFVSNNRDELINDIQKFFKEYKVEY